MQHNRTMVRNGRDTVWLATRSRYHDALDVHTPVYRSLPRSVHPTRHTSPVAAYWLLYAVLLLSLGLFVDALLLFKLL